MKYLFLILACTGFTLHSDATSSRRKKDREFTGYERQKHHRHRKQTATEIAEGTATAIGNAAISEAKKRRTHDYNNYAN
jgi:hypothetical protein